MCPGQETSYKTSRHHRLECGIACLPGFVEIHGVQFFNSFECLRGVNPLLFPQLCLYLYAEVSIDHNLGVQSVYHQTNSDIQSTPTKLAHFTKKSSPTFH